MHGNCIICNSTNLETFFYQEKVPASINQLGRSIHGTLDIVHCLCCSHIFNRAFDEDIINEIYNNDNYSASLPVSKNMIERFKYRAESVIGDEHIKNKTVIEVGSTDFSFSKILLNLKATKIIAFEPATSFKTQNPKIQLIQDYFSTLNIKKFVPHADLIVMRHVLEHLKNPLETIMNCLKSMKVGAKFYIEVPNINNILENSRVYDFFYEHVSYFSPELLKYIIKELGHEIHKVAHLISGQHFGILIEKKRTNESARANFSNFKYNHSLIISKFKIEIQSFEGKLLKILSTHNDIAIYGAGGHAISIISRLNLSTDQVKFLLDLSPHKIGKKSPTGSIPIIKPSRSRLESINCIIIFASLHQKEICSFLQHELGYNESLYGTFPSIKKLQ
jgi:hypothetical protein